MSKKIIVAGLLLSAFAVLSGRASAGIFSEEEAAKLNKSAKGAFSEEEAALLNKKPQSAPSYGAQGGNFGIELSGAYWSLGDSSFEEVCNDGTCMDWPDTGKSDQGSIGIGAALFWETGSDIRGGLSLGYSILPTGEYKKTTALNWGAPNTGTETDTWENSAYSIPLTLYFKIRQSEKMNLTGGVSVDYIHAKVKKTDITVWDPGATMGNSSVKKEYTGKRLVPGASLGVEMFPVKNISVLAGLKYMFFGSVTNFEDKDGDPVWLYRYSFSGLRVNLAARYYFGG